MSARAVDDIKKIIEKEVHHSQWNGQMPPIDTQSQRAALLKSQGYVYQMADDYNQMNRNANEGLQTISDSLNQLHIDGDVLNEVLDELSLIDDQAKLSDRVLGAIIRQEKIYRIILYILLGVNSLAFIVGILYYFIPHGKRPSL